MAYSGRYRPDNPEKYRGNPTNIIYRSWWERKAFRWLDRHTDVVWWNSEETVVPYVSPLDNKIHRYFPDILVCMKMRDGSEKVFMIEIKPASQSRPPDPRKRNATPTGRISRRYLNEAKTYAVNQAKWEAARAYCNSKGWEFMVWGEKELGIK